MAMTHEVRDELSRVPVTQDGCRRVQLAAILRLASELRVSSGGKLVVEAEVSTLGLARYLHREIPALYGIDATATAISDTGLRKGARYMVRVGEGGTRLAIETGMMDERQRLVAGLSPAIFGGSLSEVAAAWRGAFLAAGTLTGPGKNTAFEIRCPAPEVAYALASCARRLGAHPMVREARGIDRVLLRDVDDIGVMLTRLGADESRMNWERRVSRRQMQATANRLVNLDDANLRRSARAAAATASRVQRALEILGEEAPVHLASTGELRIQHGEASLEELGQLAQPPMTKDAVAGRLRRLLTLADKHAADEGVPGTEVADFNFAGEPAPVAVATVPAIANSHTDVDPLGSVHAVTTLGGAVR